jgi:hypothetical protein
MINLPKPHFKLPIRRTAARKRDEDAFSRGQIIVLFALTLTVLIGILGLAIDVSFAWVSELRMQRTADAAALAGAVYLPDDATTAAQASLDIAKQNGYIDGATVPGLAGSVVVDAQRNNTNHEQMDVTVSGPIPTFFMRIFGVTTLTPSRTSHAQFHLPVPMGSPLNVFGIPTATDLAGNPLNFWAGIQGPCTLKANGDPYATKDTTSVHSNCAAAGVANTEYHNPTTGDAGAYDYAVRVPAVNGTLKIELYDPEFCARSDQGQDTGDTQFTSGSKFSTVFTLYNPSDTPYDLTDDTVANGGAATTSYPGDNSTSSGATHSCSNTYVSGNSGSNYVGKWITFATVTNAPVGTFRLNIQTLTNGSSPADGSNMFGIRATLNAGSGTQPQVYAGLAGTQSAMSIYNNLPAGDSWLYLAQINSTMAGKTMEVDLFDPGDMDGTGKMYFEQPGAGTTYTPVSFSWRDAGVNLGSTGLLTTGVTVLETATNGTSHFNGHWVVVTIRIPDTYTAPQNGWWKIKYNFTGVAHERTTWRCEIIDSPVHLVGLG